MVAFRTGGRVGNGLHNQKHDDFRFDRPDFGGLLYRCVAVVQEYLRLKRHKGLVLAGKIISGIGTFHSGYNSGASCPFYDISNRKILEYRCSRICSDSTFHPANSGLQGAAYTRRLETSGKISFFTGFCSVFSYSIVLICLL